MVGRTGEGNADLSWKLGGKRPRGEGSREKKKTNCKKRKSTASYGGEFVYAVYAVYAVRV